MAGDPERYATAEELASDLGLTYSGNADDPDLRTALGSASDEIDRLCDLQNQTDYSVPTANFATRRLAARWWQRKDSPMGVMGGFTDIPLYVRGTDPDIDRMILSMRHHFGLA